MGTVYRGRHSLMRRPVAIKVLHGAHGGAPARDRLDRFEREVTFTCRLTHPNTIAVYDYGRTLEGTFYYVMELLDGASLQRVVGAAGPLDVGRAVYLGRQICGSLAEAHAAGIVHRDVKPPNVQVCRRGGSWDTVKVLDFGLVEEIGAAAADDDVLVGTPEYLAPELIAAATSPSPSTDIYALGGVLYFMLTGAPVFAAPSLRELLRHHVDIRPPPPSSRRADGSGGDLDAIVLACLEKDPAVRPGSVAEVADHLARSDAPPWSAEAAAAWWHEHSASLRHTDPGPSTSRRMTIDVVGRRP
jgi:serine/threonine-protein kinase